MADYYTTAVINAVPNDIVLKAEEHELLEQTGFDVQNQEGRGFYGYSSDGPRETCMDELAELELDADVTSLARRILARNYPGTEDNFETIDFDHNDVLQQILIDREHTGFIQVESSFSCSKGRADGFGGSGVHVTATTLEYVTTSLWLAERQAAHERRMAAQSTAPAPSE